MRKVLTFIILSLCMIASAQKSEPANQAPANELHFALVSCQPGPEIFELYGHEAMHIWGTYQGREMDFIVNHGLFDFGSPGFISRFVKGETDYFTGTQDTRAFLDSYAERGSGVTEYELNLTPAESDKLMQLVISDLQPPNNTYRYKYFTNNCATRLLSPIDSAIEGTVKYTMPDTPTYRGLLRKYGEGYPWYELGIETALGSGLDKKLTPREQLFLPLELGQTLPSALRPDGKKLIIGSKEIVKEEDARLAPTLFILSPQFFAIVLLVLVLIFKIYSFFTGKPIKIITSLMSLLLGLGGCLVWFLTFFSDHEAASPNILAIWLNPLWFIILVTIWIKRCYRFSAWLLAIEGAGAALVAILSICGMQTLHPVQWLLLAATVLLSIPEKNHSD